MGLVAIVQGSRSEHVLEGYLTARVVGRCLGFNGKLCKPWAGHIGLIGGLTAIIGDRERGTEEAGHLEVFL